VDELDKAILEYLKSRDGGWRWVLGTKVFTRDETIRLYEKDKEFRKLIREQVYKLAVELFAKGKGQ